MFGSHLSRYALAILTSGASADGSLESCKEYSKQFGHAEFPVKAEAED